MDADLREIYCVQTGLAFLNNILLVMSVNILWQKLLKKYKVSSFSALKELTLYCL